MIRETTLAALLATVCLGVAACDRQGPAERFGEKVDHAVDTMKNGGEEPASDKLEDAAHDAREAVEGAANDLEKRD